MKKSKVFFKRLFAVEGEWVAEPGDDSAKVGGRVSGVGDGSAEVGGGVAGCSKGVAQGGGGIASVSGSLSGRILHAAGRGLGPLIVIGKDRGLQAAEARLRHDSSNTPAAVRLAAA